MTNDHLVHTAQNHHPSKVDVLSKTFLQIILAAKWFVRHSITSPNQQRRPLTSLLYLFFFYAYHVDPILIYRGHNSCSLDPIHGHRHLEHTSSDTPSNGNPRLTYKRYTVYSSPRLLKTVVTKLFCKPFENEFKSNLRQCTKLGNLRQCTKLGNL